MPPVIIVVDDDADGRDALAEALVATGHAVEQADDGLMALRQIAQQAPDLILSDVQMPHLGGIGLAPHALAIPIILMSGNPLPRGCLLPFIRKPFAVEALLTLMARTLPVSSVATVALSGLDAV
jgi:CheY-like chemotaxis protein